MSLATPTISFDPSSGLVTLGYNLLGGAVCQYTLDDTDPATIIGYDAGGAPILNGALYEGPFALTSAATVRAVALYVNFGEGLWTVTAGTESSLAIAQCATPIISPVAGAYTEVGGALTITITGAAGQTKRYTIDGSTPSETNGYVYTVPFTLHGSATVQAIAYAAGSLDSAVAAAVYVVAEPVCATPTISLGAGAYYAGRQTQLLCATAGATTRYTTNGSLPTAYNSTVYTGPLTLTAGMTLQVYATLAGYQDSAVASAVYEVVLPSGLSSVALMTAQIWDDVNRDSTSLSAALVLQHLNMAYQYVAQLTKCFRAYRTLPVAANGEIVLPSDTREVTEIRHDGRRLEACTEAQLERDCPNWRGLFGRPRGWVRRAPLLLALVGWWRRVDTVTVTCVTQPTADPSITDGVPALVNSGDCPAFPDPYGRLVLLRAEVTLSKRAMDDALIQAVAQAAAAEFGPLLIDFKSDQLSKAAYSRDFARNACDDDPVGRYREHGLEWMHDVW